MFEYKVCYEEEKNCFNEVGVDLLFEVIRFYGLALFRVFGDKFLKD